MPTDIMSEVARPAEQRGAGRQQAAHLLFRLLFRAALALPPSLLLRIAGEPPRVVEGRRLDPRVQFHAWFVQRFRKPLTVSPTILREHRLLSLFLLDGKAAPVSFEDRSIPGAAGPLRARIYRPARNGGACPVLVYFHFGGCVLGDLETCHTLCSRLASEAGIIVVSSQYRLAPEHKFPAAVEDAVSAYRWTLQNAQALGGAPQRVGVGGDSAGGYLAGAVSLACRDSGEPPPSLQLLIYPVTEMDRARVPEGPHDGDYPLSRADMVWFSEQYLVTPAEAENPLCSLARARDLKGLPPALVCLAGHDVLREEGLAFAARLKADDVPVTLRVFDSLPHAFTAMCGAIPDARRAVSEMARLLTDQFSRPKERDDSHAG